MAEFSPQLAPLGIPGNPLEGTPMGQDIQRRKKELGTKDPLQTPNTLDQLMEHSGGHGPSLPQVIASPAPVSALDPAYSSHPIAQALSRGPAATGTSGQGTGDSPWVQLLQRKPSSRSFLNTRSLHAGLGMDLPYQQQGASSIA